MNFKSNSNYKKWLAYGHASGEFAKTPGNQSVSIQGEPKKVQHNMMDGGNLFCMGGKNYLAGGEVDAFGNLIEEFPKPIEMNIEGTDTKGLGTSTPMNGNQQNYISQPGTRQPTINSGTNTQGELENAGIVPGTTDDPTKESQNIASSALKSGFSAGMKTGNPLIGLGVAAASFGYNKLQQGMNNRKEIRQEEMAAADFEKSQQMNSTYADPNSVYYSAADGAAVKSKHGRAGSQKITLTQGKGNTPSTQTKEIKMADGGNTLKPGGGMVEGEIKNQMSTVDKVKSDATSLFKMMTDMINPVTPSPQLPKPNAMSPADVKNKVKLTSGAKAGVKAIA